MDLICKIKVINRINKLLNLLNCMVKLLIVHKIHQSFQVQLEKTFVSINHIKKKNIIESLIFVVYYQILISLQQVIKLKLVEEV